MARMNADSSATYKQLDDGSWGAWVKDLPAEMLRPGKTIGVTDRYGGSHQEKLAKRLWASDDNKLQLWSLKEK